MNLRANRTVTADSAQRWSGIDAGRRVQMSSPVTGIRHFRVGASNVKRAESFDMEGGLGVNARLISATVRILAASLRPALPAGNRPTYDLFQ